MRLQTSIYVLITKNILLINVRKRNNINKELKNNFFIAEVIESLNSDSITKENLRPRLKF